MACKMLGPSQAVLAKLNCWGACTLARAHRVSSELSAELGSFLRQLHREGHQLYTVLGANLREMRALIPDRWVRDTSGIVRQALRTGLHPRRFGRPTRWEAQLVKHYGEC